MILVCFRAVHYSWTHQLQLSLKSLTAVIQGIVPPFSDPVIRPRLLLPTHWHQHQETMEGILVPPANPITCFFPRPLCELVRSPRWVTVAPPHWDDGPFHTPVYRSLAITCYCHIPQSFPICMYLFSFSLLICLFKMNSFIFAIHCFCSFCLTLHCFPSISGSSSTLLALPCCLCCDFGV